MREIAHAAVSRRPPMPLDTMVSGTGGCAYDVGVWDLSIVQGPFSVAPCQNPLSYDSQLLHRCTSVTGERRCGKRTAAAAASPSSRRSAPCFTFCTSSLVRSRMSYLRRYKGLKLGDDCSI
jgi:hypothetical protein